MVLLKLRNNSLLLWHFKILWMKGRLVITSYLDILLKYEASTQ